MHTRMPLIHILLCRHVYILCVCIVFLIQFRFDIFFIRMYLLKLYSLKNIFYILKNGLQNELYECTRLSKNQVLDRHIKMWLSVLSYLLCVLFDYISIIFL